jgi:2-keto-4-pentenoate hydratase
MKSIAELAAALISAHEGGPLLDRVPEHLLPADLDAVYALQDEVIAQIGPVGGWKVAAGLGDPPLCSPIPANRFLATADLIDGEKRRIFLAEIEVAVQLGEDLPGGAPPEAVEAAIASLHPAIELIGTPFIDRDATPRNLQLGDLQSNGAVIVGKAMDRALVDALASLPVTLELDGRPAHAVGKGASWDDIVGAIAWLAGHAEQRGHGLKAGQVIITGARALAPLNGAKTIEGMLGEWGRVTCGV